MNVGGALAWHPSVAMTQEEIDEFLSGRWVARLATIGKDGYPHAAPFWYYWDGECLYISVTRKRQSCKNLMADPRCSVIIDMDDRPLTGIRCNLAKAVLIIGDAELFPADSDRKFPVVKGPWRGEHTAAEFVRGLLSRYLLFGRDGALGMTGESLGEVLYGAQARESQLYKDNEERVLARIVPRKIQAWDFSKAPIEYIRE